MSKNANDNVNLNILKEDKANTKTHIDLRILREEKGMFTIEATIICLFIVVITMTLVMNVIKIYDNSIENREKENERYAIEAFATEQDVEEYYATE
ncbi:MAG: hypothetical protein E7262_03665 [Lachnospiraceae bacterium]|nr:hypothetical protein [Lachnospiraceae bacterium]